MRALTLSLALLVAAPVALAGVVDCDALTAAQRRQAEAIGACGAAPMALCIPASGPGLAALFAYWGSQAGYQPTVPCEAERRVDERGIWIAAGPGDGACTVEVIGPQIPNPQPLPQAAYRWWRAEQNREIREQRANEAAEAERERAAAEAATALPEEDP